MLFIHKMKLDLDLVKLLIWTDSNFFFQNFMAIDHFILMLLIVLLCVYLS